MLPLSRKVKCCCLDIEPNFRFGITVLSLKFTKLLLLVLVCHRKRCRPLSLEVTCMRLDWLRDPAVESERFRRDLKTHLFAGH